MKTDETRPDVAAIRERVEATTPGPWGTEDDCVYSFAGLHPSVAYTNTNFEMGQWQADAEFIAAARTDIPELLAYIATLERCARVAERALEIIGETIAFQEVDELNGEPYAWSEVNMAYALAEAAMGEEANDE